MHFRLWHKLLIIVGLILIGAIGGLTVFTYHATREAMFEEFHIRGRELGKAIASESMNYYLNQDVERFTTLLQTLGEAEGVLAILAYTGQSDLWVESSIIELAPSELTLTAPPLLAHREFQLKTGMGVTEFWQPVPIPFPPKLEGPPETQGWIRVILDRHSLETRLSLLLWRTLGISGLTMLGGAGLVLVMLRHSLKVVTPLTQATQQVAAGRLDISVPVLSHDELGQLAAGFNQMTDRLYQTTVSKDYLDSILKSMMDCLIVIDRTGVIQTLNHAAEHLLRYTSAELIGQPIAKIFPPMHNPFTPEGIDHVLVHGRYGHKECSFLTKHGTLIPILLSASTMQKSDGTIRGIACLAQDITIRKEAEDQLRFSHGLLKTIDTAQSQFIAEQDPVTTFQKLLDQLMALTQSPLGYIGEIDHERARSPYYTDHVFLHRHQGNLLEKQNPGMQYSLKEITQMLERFHQSASLGRPTIFDNSTPNPREQPKDIWPIPIDTIICLPFHSGESVVGLLALGNRPEGYPQTLIDDLQPVLSTCGNLIEAFRNEQRRLYIDRALRESIERFDLAVQGSRDGLWDARAVTGDLFLPTTPVYFSPRFKALLGFSDHEFPNVLGSWATRLHPDDREKAIQDLKNHLFDRIPYDSEYRMLDKSGNCRWFSGRGQAIWDEAGQPLRISGSFSDITERKHAQAELEKANARLKELDQLRSQFFADISHELRTPLTVIRGEAEVTLRGKDKPTEDYKTTLQRIVQLTDEVNKLVSDLLFLARSETGTIQITKHELALGKLLQDVLPEALILARKKHILISLEETSTPIRIQGDVQRLKQLLLILLDNAIKYSDSQSQIRIAIHVDVAYATITIQDQGQGIAEHDLPHIFERFYRGHRTQGPTQPGAGLGLAIAKWITEAHEGQIQLASQPGKGTTVTLRFPLHPLPHEVEHAVATHRG